MTQIITIIIAEHTGDAAAVVNHFNQSTTLPLSYTAIHKRTLEEGDRRYGNTMDRRR